jgi:ATP-dependent DNA helicase RecG
VCAFLNGSGGIVLFGVRQDGRVEGQHVSDSTLREIAQAADHLEPPAHVTIRRVAVEAGREVIAVAVGGDKGVRPFAYAGGTDTPL